jgi:hypothetical protein
VSDKDYIAKAITAAPEAITKGAAIVAMENDGTMRTLQRGINGFTCMVIPDGTPMCMDQGGKEWIHALMVHTTPPAKGGFMYVLNGVAGRSNTDPYARGPKPDNHWVKTGPHVMVVGPLVKTMVLLFCLGRGELSLPHSQ